MSLNKYFSKNIKTNSNKFFKFNLKLKNLFQLPLFSSLFLGEAQRKTL